MVNEQIELFLDQVYEFRSGLSKPASEFGFGNTFLTFKDVFYNYFIPDELTELVNSSERERELCSINRGDVFLTRTSETMEELGMSCVALKDYPGATFNGFTKRLRPNTEIEIVPEYAAYYFRSPSFRQDVTSMSSLSTRASLNNEMLGRLKIVLPKPEAQRVIGSTLKCLDDKIHLNHQISQTLESIAQTIFKSWFVDFDPVKAKMEGREPEGMDAEAAALFPDRLVESELGMIPEGWDISSFGSIVERQKQRIGNQSATVLSAVSSGELVNSDEHFKKRVYSKSIKKYLKVEKWDFAYNPSRINIGSIGMLDRNLVGAVSPIYIVFRSNQYRWLIWFHLKRQSIKNEIASLCSGSVRQSLNYKDFASISVALPPIEIFSRFEANWKSFRALIIAKEAESEIISDLRDTLLPKLISGEIQIPTK